MRGKGITYDTGFFHAGVSTHEPFDSIVVKREMRIIHDDLHCNAVRITGGSADRLEVAAAHAVEAGLEVWFSPFTCDLATDELLLLLADCAERAERLRTQGAEVVVVTGAELGLFTRGFLPGAHWTNGSPCSQRHSVCTKSCRRYLLGSTSSSAALPPSSASGSAVG